MDDNNQPNAFDQMAAALNGHEITDDEGQTQEEQTSFDNTADQETNTVEETAIPEKGAESEDVAPAAPTETENELAADETGKRYVPESRFKEVYAKAKDLERQLEQSKTKDTASLQDKPSANNQPLPVASDKTEALEVELLKATLPQFDKDSAEYDRTLDEIGSEIYRANPGITRLEAGKRALKRAEQLSRASATIKAEARQVKAIQSDQGITSRVEKRSETAPDINKMNDKQLEELLRSTGQW